ncbi:hypothetical protein [Micromonospora chalcea]|uniref:hypothetical protein n=1 Tax=Micromonospora chalcea TaxID=1874 RepID=UPI003D73E35F
MNVKERHSEPPLLVTVERDVIAMLIDAELTHLWLTERDEGCCPECCAPCAALKRLLELGQLDDLIRSRAGRNDWWDADNDQVDRVWLAAAWRRTDCGGQHQNEGEARR